MKKIVFSIVLLSFLMAGKTYGQKNDLLIRYDVKEFEKEAKNINHEEFVNKQRYALEVFRQYSEKKSVSVDFTEKDYSDKLKEVEGLQKNKEKLEKAKEKIDNDLKKEQENAKELNKENNSLQTRIRDLESTNRQLERDLSSLPGLQNSIKELEEEKNELQTQVTTLTREKDDLDFRKTQLENQISSFDAEKELIEKQRDDAVAAKEEAEEQLRELRRELASKKDEIQDLGRIIKTKDDENKGFKSASENATTTIVNTYNDNFNKSIVDMDIKQLEQARSKFDGMKSLLELDQKTYAELNSKINEIDSWKTLAGPLKEAKQYLKGKYDDKKRNECIVAINNVKVNGKKANEEKQAMLRNLQNEPQLYENYAIIIRNLEEAGCLPDKQQLMEANDMLNDRIGKVASYYKPNVYDSYDRGINTIKDQLEKNEPGFEVKTGTEFNKFIKQLREIF